jgi:integrase
VGAAERDPPVQGAADGREPAEHPAPRSAPFVRDVLLAHGVNPRVVMETLGHSQVSLTLNTYSHVLPTLQRDAAARMDNILPTK